MQRGVELVEQLIGVPCSPHSVPQGGLPCFQEMSFSSSSCCHHLPGGTGAQEQAGRDAAPKIKLAVGGDGPILHQLEVGWGEFQLQREDAAITAVVASQPPGGSCA